jgi:hypothetical protein
MSVNGGSTSFGHASWKINWLSGNIKPISYYRPSFLVKIVATTSLLCPNNEHQQTVNDFWLCITANASAALRHQAIIKPSATIPGNNG